MLFTYVVLSSRLAAYLVPYVSVTFGTPDGLSTELRNVSDAQLMIIVILSPILLLLVLVPQLPGHIIFEGSLPAFRLFEVPDHQLQFSLSVSSVSYVSNGTGSCNNTILVILECIFLAW
jgi:hypothetical protein